MYVVIHSMQAEVKPWLRSILILLTTILLIAHQHLQRTLSDVERVVQQGLVVLYALKGIRRLQFVGLGIALAFYHTRTDVVVRQFQVRVSPVLIDAHHSLDGSLLEL